MDYGRIVRDAIRLTLRHRFLWVFALLGGSSSSFGGGAPDLNLGSRGSTPTPPEEMPPELERLFEAVQKLPDLLAAHLATIIGVAALLFLVGLVLFAISFVCRGALIGSIVRLANGEPASVRIGWGIGTRLGWRYFRLWLMGCIIVLLAVVAVASIGVIIYIFGAAGEALRVLAIVLGVIVGLAAFGLAIAFAIVLSICFAFAERAIAVDGLGVRQALRRGAGLLMVEKGASVLLWLVAAGMGIGTGIVLTIIALIVGLPLALAVIATYFAVGMTGATIAATALAIAVWILILWGISAVGSTYNTTYWTLGYLAITDRYPPTVVS